MTAPDYRETILSKLYPGNQTSSPTYQPTVDALNALVGWPQWKKEQTILRTDAGFGGDDNINYALTHGWQVLTKGHGGRRPGALAKQIAPGHWSLIGPERWIAPVPRPVIYAKPTRTLLLKWLNQRRQIKLATIVCSICHWSMPQIIAHYDARAQCETQIQADKGGLKLCKRTKQSLPAQEALVLLTDLAHNLVAWIPQWMALEKPFDAFGTTRFLDDILAIPGELTFEQERLVAIRLNQHHPYSQATADGLRRLLAYFDNP